MFVERRTSESLFFLLALLCPLLDGNCDNIACRSLPAHSSLVVSKPLSHQTQAVVGLFIQARIAFEFE
jgi:hypothetical protein